MKAEVMFCTNTHKYWLVDSQGTSFYSNEVIMLFGLLVCRNLVQPVYPQGQYF